MLHRAAGVHPNEVSSRSYKHGLFDFARHVCADSANGLVWCAADSGRRIKAFRAPQGVAPKTKDAGCNQGSDNGMPLQYTLSTDVHGMWGSHVGLHVMGTNVLCVSGG